MAFINTNILPILKEQRARPFSGHLLSLGYPTVHLAREKLAMLAKLADTPLIDRVDASAFQPVYSQHETGCISAAYLFGSLGFEQLSSMDVSDYEGADTIFDLNSPGIPDTLVERFDAIVDHGTLEHVFNVPNALSNICRMLRVGGRVIHTSPGSNFFDHGFYSFSPTLFFDYYTSNQWRIESLQVYQMSLDREAAPFFADYRPGVLSSQCYGGLDDKMYGTICIATKTHTSTDTRTPQQSAYRDTRAWQEGLRNAHLHADSDDHDE